MSKNLSEKLRSSLNQSSFKIKPILLELKNYSFFHFVENKENDDIYDRFLGRKAIINRLKSFIHDTNRNTGTYLVSGFRGMGKTSVVNKAVSSLNPKSKVLSFFVLWLFLLPLVVFYKPIISFYETFCANLLAGEMIAFIVFFLLSIFYLGHRSPRRRHCNKIGVNLVRKLFRGFESLFNPKFYKHKYIFHRQLRIYILYILSMLFFIGYYSYFETHGGGAKKGAFEFFWFVSLIIIFWYLLIDVYIEYVTYKKGRGSFKWQHRAFALIPVFFVFFGILGLHFLRVPIIFNLWFKISIVIIYLFLKAFFKHSNKHNAKKVYNVTLSRILTFFDLQHYISVKINLGKDNLTEKDVLKYITNELFREYRRWYYNLKSFKRFGNVLILLLLIYLMCTVVYRSFLGEEFRNFSKNQFKIAYFFPSQALLSEEDKLTDGKIEKLFVFDKNEGSKIQLYNDSVFEFIKPGDKGDISKNNVVGYANLRDNNSVFLKKQADNVNVKRENAVYEAGEQTIFNKVIVSVGMLCNELDYLTLKLWYKTRRTVVSHQADLPIINRLIDADMRHRLSKVYPKVPVLTVFVLMFFVLVSYRFIPNRFLIIKTHYYVLRELKKLKKEIDASIIIEQGGGANGGKSTFFSYLKRSSYAPLESKDITQRLIHLLDDVSNISPIFTKVRLIFIFDELDKINSNHNTVISNLEDEFEGNNNEVRYQARRKERISRILSSMKHFLNSAHAKFIFIAGREMYDAALAGISDRESSLDSIFNDNKIYVNSFYTEGEDNNLADISSITEQYLCQFLIPEFYLTAQESEYPSLKMYNKYLKKEVKLEDPEREKIIATLKNFVIYLTYRSNGAPRKLSNLLEQYIYPVSRWEVSEPEIKRNIVVGSNDENLFLKISFYDQYKFNLISYLTSPIFLRLGNYIHEYSDKLLVSISYMLDHIFKHHKFGLSYRSLSLTPEIVDINKEPQFREFLDKLIGYLNKSHLRPIVSGIYDYKFHGKIEAEIKFLSKIDEQEAAAFNFTLDESIELKRHFNRRLESLKQKDADIIVNNKNGYKEDYINNISLLHIMIGDLHFYDEEYHEAIVHYMDAIQVLRQKNIKDMTLYEFVIFVRNQLKLGLAFEKNKMFDNALMTFSELTDLVIRKRNIPLYKMGLARFIIKKEGDETEWVKAKLLEKFFGEHFDPSALSEREKRGVDVLTKFLDDPEKKELIVIGRLKEDIVKAFNEKDNTDRLNYWKTLYSIEDMALFYGVKSTDITKNIEEVETNYKPIKNYYSQSTGENIRVLYQPIISKLHLIEKTSPDKLKDIDIVRAIKEFNFLKSPLRTVEKRIIVAEFYNKIGDLLYFKNGTLNKCLKSKLFDNIDNLDGNNEKEKKISKHLLISPLDATLFYIKSLAILLIPIDKVCTDCGDKGKPLHVINFEDYYNIKTLKNLDGNVLNFETFFEEVKMNFNAIEGKINKMISGSNKTFKERYAINYLLSIANGIVSLLECLTSYVEKQNTQNSSEEIEGGECHLNPCFVCKRLGVSIEQILNMYHFSSEIYRDIGEYRLARSQKLKILYTLNQCSAYTLAHVDIESLKFIEASNDGKKGVVKLQSILEDTIKLSYSANNETFYLELDQLKELLSNSNFSDVCKNSIIGQEVIEAIAIYWHFVHKMNRISKDEEHEEHKIDQWLLPTEKGKEEKESLNDKLKRFLAKNILPTGIIMGKNNRLLMLSLFLKYNKSILNDAPLLSDNNNEIKESKEFLILNSIGACNEIIKTHDIFSVNYVTTSNIGLARAHYLMAFWCGEYTKLFEDESEELKSAINKSDLNKILKEEILNSDNLTYMDEFYHYRLSLDYNYKVKDFHTRGATLHTFLKSVSYLDDFYSDNLIHFSISIERNRLQEGHIDKKIKKINDMKSPFGFEDFY